MKRLSIFEKAMELDPRNASVHLGCGGELRRVWAGIQRRSGPLPRDWRLTPRRISFGSSAARLRCAGRVRPAPMRAALGEIPREFDPGGGVTLMAVRLGLMERDPDAAERSLGAFPHARYNDTGVGGIAGTLDGYSFPPSWLRGLIARARGDQATARREFEAALADVNKDLCCCSADAKTVMMQGFVQAALGNREEAIRHGEAAAAMLPIVTRCL